MIRRFPQLGVPPNHPFLFGDFPWNKPSSSWTIGMRPGPAGIRPVCGWVSWLWVKVWTCKLRWVLDVHSQVSLRTQRQLVKCRDSEGTALRDRKQYRREGSPNDQWQLNPCWLMIFWGILLANINGDTIIHVQGIPKSNQPPFSSQEFTPVVDHGRAQSCRRGAYSNLFEDRGRPITRDCHHLPHSTHCAIWWNTGVPNLHIRPVNPS